MDASDESQRKSNTSSDWTTNAFERVNHSTNFEDYACTSDETNFLYGNSHTKQPFKTSIPLITGDSVSNSLNKSKFEAHLWIPVSDTSSAEVTPSGTPQSSPYSIRKAMESKRIAKSSDNQNQKNELLSNPKRWFYAGFGSDVKQGLSDKPITQLPKNPSFKNLCVSNFDINAVGPTSW